MAKTVWHLGAWSHCNFGDEVLCEATQNIIRERYKKDIKFVPINCQKTYFFPELIEKMNNEADMLLIGGGGLIMNRPEDNSHSGWQVNIRTEDISKIKIPIVVYGIGYNKFPYDTHTFPDSMWQNIQEIINRSALFSVRNQGTLESLMSANINVNKVQIVPDAGMFIKADKYTHECLQTDKVKIGVNWATDRPGQRFSSESLADQKMYEFLRALKPIAQKNNAKVFLIDHLLKEQRNLETKNKLHKAAEEVLGDNVVILYNELFEDLFPPFDYLAGFFADIYRQMDLVIGMRGHANIIAFGQNTPCIGLGQHNKVKWFLAHTGMEHLLVSLDGTPCELENRMTYVIEDVINNKEQYKRMMDFNLTQLSYIKDSFIDRVIGVLNGTR